MKTLPWLRLYSDLIDNEKIKLLAFEDRWHFISILCLKQQGVLDSKKELLERKIAVKIGVQLSELDHIKRRLIEVELINEDYQPIGWNEKQFTSDSSSERTRKYRENKKKKVSDNNETSQERHGDALDTDTDTDTDTDIKSPKKPTLKKKLTKATPFPEGKFNIDEPMFDWAMSVGAKEHEIEQNTLSFKDYHLSKGSQFKDWSAAWRNWMRKSVEYRKAS